MRNAGNCICAVSAAVRAFFLLFFFLYLFQPHLKQYVIHNRWMELIYPHEVFKMYTHRFWSIEPGPPRLERDTSRCYTYILFTDLSTFTEICK